MANYKGLDQILVYRNIQYNTLGFLRKSKIMQFAAALIELEDIILVSEGKG